MRKLIWVSLAGTALLVGGIGTTAYLAGRYPNSVAGHVGGVRNPFEGTGPVLARVETDVDGIPDDPVPVGASVVPAQIVIPEDEASVSAGLPTFEHLLTPCPKAAEGAAVTTVAHTAPTVMPYTDDGCLGRKTAGDRSAVVTTAYTVEPERMPYADECEKLHMPCFVEEGPLTPVGAEEEQEEAADTTDTPSTGAAGKLIRGLEQLLKRATVPDAVPAPGAPACQEDPNYHQHYSGCPYSGHSTCPNRGYPGRTDPPSSGESHHRSAIQKIRSYKVREAAEEPAPTGVDTTEMRPEDQPGSEPGHGKF